MERQLVVWLVCLLYSVNANTAEWAIESDIDTRIEYNDNIFLTNLPHESVYGLTVIPSAKMVAREQNWESFLNTELRSYNYSDHNIDSNDVFLDFSGTYQKVRNMYTLTAAYHKDSNLNALSSDFGVTGQRVNRKLWYLAPQYTRLINERLLFSATYNHTDVDYIDAENTGFVPYKLDTLSGSLAYNLTEKDTVSFVLRATDYASKDGVFEYQLFITQMGIEHKLTELWSIDYAIGGSRRNSTNQATTSVDFPGQSITITQEIDFSDKGYVLNAGIARKTETGSVSGRISRNDVANSQGGLNEVSTIHFDLNQGITELWRYSIGARYEVIDAVSTFDRNSDRELLFFEPRIYYTIDRHWTANASYRYIQRKFKSDTSDDRAPHSNRIYIGMTYNFPDISTF